MHFNICLHILLFHGVFDYQIVGRISENNVEKISLMVAVVAKNSIDSLLSYFKLLPLDWILFVFHLIFDCFTLLDEVTKYIWEHCILGVCTLFGKFELFLFNFLFRLFPLLSFDLKLVLVGNI